MDATMSPSLSLHEKLAYFYGSYVHEVAVEPNVDADAVRLWDKITSSRRKCRERVSFLLMQIENVSTARVRHLDNAFKAKRELLLLAEGTIGGSTSPRRHGHVLTQVEAARVNNTLLQESGALGVFSQNLQRSLHAFRSLNLQHLDLDQLDAMIREFQQDMVLMYLLIVFNAHRQNLVFERELFVLGTSAPSYVLVAIVDCLVQLNVLPGFPVKRLLLLCCEWMITVMGDNATLNNLKQLRRAKHDNEMKASNGTNTTSHAPVSGKQAPLSCKSYGTYVDTAVLDPQDPYYLQKKKFAQVRAAIHDKYLHQPHHALKACVSNDTELATAALSGLDDEWESRCEVIYQLFLPRTLDFTTFLANLVNVSCGSALNARDKKTFYSRRPSTAEQIAHGMGEFSAHHDAPGPGDNGRDNHYWKWILREKAIVLDISTLLILNMFKQFRNNHPCKSEYVMHFFLEANLVPTLTKFMNKDLATYLQVARQDTDEVKNGFYALENELRKSYVRGGDHQDEFAMQPTRTVTSILRILQKMTKRKPNVIKNTLCRSSSIVWLKRVVSLGIPAPRLYALKLVKSQAKYLGHQWVRKYTCANLVTDIYLYVRPQLDDDWLIYEDEDLNKPPSQDSVERILFGDMQAYHHKHYWDPLNSKPLSAEASAIVVARNELDADVFDVEGGRLAKFYNSLTLDPVQFCQQYEKWLDREDITADKQGFATTLPISFGG